MTRAPSTKVCREDWKCTSENEQQRPWRSCMVMEAVCILNVVVLILLYAFVKTHRTICLKGWIYLKKKTLTLKIKVYCMILRIYSGKGKTMSHSKYVSGCRGLVVGSRPVEHRGFLEQWNCSSESVPVATRHYRVVETHRIYNTTSGPWYKLWTSVNNISIWLIDCNKCTTWMKNVNNRGMWEISVLSTETFINLNLP